MTARLDPLEVRRQLRAAGIQARHSYSQNFLADPAVLQAILDEAAPAPGRRILEIGPGLGILTGGLLAAGAVVTAVEIDRGLAARLRRVQAAAVELHERLPGAPGSLHLVEEDFLDRTPADLVVPPYDVVANLPYHITSPVLHLLLGAPPRPGRAVLMVQREVADRLAAPPGGLSYLSVFVQYQARVRLAFTVPREAFEPAPAVESAVIVLEPRPDDDPGRIAPAAEDDLWRLVQAGFRERRKMLHNVLARQLPLPRATVEAALAATGIDGARRPQTLGMTDWIALLGAVGPLPPDPRGRRAEPRGAAVEPEP